MLALTPTAQHTVWTLAAQMMAAAASDADRARIDRALDLVETVERTATPGLFLVGSQSNSNGAYRVRDGLCCCADASRRDARHCKHVFATVLYQQAERLDVEQSDPTPAPDDDTYYCVLCEEPIPAAEVVETRWGFMHERCAATEPRETDEDARYELTGRAHLAPVPTAALPASIGTIQRVPVVLSARAAQAASELYEDYPMDAA